MGTHHLIFERKINDASPYKPLAIGGIVIDFPVVLAALAGYSDRPFRLICRSCGAPYATTEVMLDSQVVREGQLRRRLAPLDKSDHPLAGQIMGSEPEVMAEAAAVLDRMGFDVVDLNFACPAKKVLARRRGGYMMRQPERALDIVRAVRERVPGKPLTLKLRRSFRETDRACEDFWKISRGAFELGAAAITVHGRSVDQKYQGPDDRAFLAQVKREFPDRTIIGSGDVLQPADALRMIEETGVDGVLAARGAIGNPWFFRQARDLAAGRPPHQPALDEQHRLILRHYELACQTYGPQRGALVMRNFGIRYARMHPQPGKVRQACLDIQNEKDWQAFMETWYGGGPRYDV
jgi:tRNA-dihydrouridine synthase B